MRGSRTQTSRYWIRLFRITRVLLRRLRTAVAWRSDFSRDPLVAAQSKVHVARRGHYLLQGNRHQNSGIIIAPCHAALSNVFLDVLGEMGGHAVVVMGENLGMPRPLLSISPPVTVHWLQALLSNYEDVLAQNHNVELSVQSVDKCCSVTLTPDKHIFMRACEPQRYIRALESRGLREVKQMPVSSHLQSTQRLHTSAAEESRLDELKQYLAVNSSTFTPQQEWLH